MSKFAKITIGTSVVVVFALIAIAFFLHHLVTKSFPVTLGVVKINGLHNSVSIYRDEYGIPHIDARDEHDAMVAVGYVHAQDRLWQMDMMRRTAEGRLADVDRKSVV